MKCPICDTEMEQWTDYMDFTLMESEDKCTNCKRYTEHFITGGYEAGVKTNNGWNVWQWHYNVSLTPDEEQNKNDAIEQAKKEIKNEL